jgi:hypothetical protein
MGGSIQARFPGAALTVRSRWCCCQSHPRSSVSGIGNSTFCNQLNLWRYSIALKLLYLQALTGRLATPELVKFRHTCPT